MCLKCLTAIREGIKRRQANPTEKMLANYQRQKRVNSLSFVRRKTGKGVFMWMSSVIIAGVNLINHPLKFVNTIFVRGVVLTNGIQNNSSKTTQNGIKLKWQMM
jgi:hypothetical protein